MKKLCLLLCVLLVSSCGGWEQVRKDCENSCYASNRDASYCWKYCMDYTEQRRQQSMAAGQAAYRQIQEDNRQRQAQQQQINQQQMQLLQMNRPINCESTTDSYGRTYTTCR